MKTNDQMAAIHGDNVYEFETTIGQGCASVLVRMSYEFDASGIYNETIASVRTMARLDITDFLEETVIDELCMLGCTLLNRPEEF
jgi:hypothetical protein